MKRVNYLGVSRTRKNAVNVLPGLAVWTIAAMQVKMSLVPHLDLNGGVRGETNRAHMWGRRVHTDTVRVFPIIAMGLLKKESGRQLNGVGLIIVKLDTAFQLIVLQFGIAHMNIFTVR